MKLILYVAIYISRHSPFFSPLASVGTGVLHSTSFVMPWVERYEYAIIRATRTLCEFCEDVPETDGCE